MPKITGIGSREDGTCRAKIDGVWVELVAADTVAVKIDDSTALRSALDTQARTRGIVGAIHGMEFVHFRRRRNGTASVGYGRPEMVDEWKVDRAKEEAAREL